MGKKGKKAKKGKGADKVVSGDIPAEVSGVKVPKKLRKLGKQAVKAVKNPVVSEVVAGALLAAAAALREGKDPKSVTGGLKNGARKAANGAGEGAERLSDTLKTLALDLARRTLDGIGEQQRTGSGNGTPHLRRKPADSEPSSGDGEGLEHVGGRGG